MLTIPTDRSGQDGAALVGMPHLTADSGT